MRVQHTSVTAGFRRAAVWLFPLVIGLHWVLLLRVLGVPSWAGCALAVIGAVFGLWLRKARQLLRHVLWSSCILAAYLGVEVLGRSLWHLYAMVSGRPETILPGSILFVAACCFIVVLVRAKDRFDPDAVLVREGDLMDRVSAAPGGAALVSMLGGAIAVLVMGAVRVFVDLPLVQLLIFVGAPMLIAALFSIMIGRTLIVINHVAGLENASGKHLFAPDLQ